MSVFPAVLHDTRRPHQREGGPRLTAVKTATQPRAVVTSEIYVFLYLFCRLHRLVRGSTPSIGAAAAAAPGGGV